jgi:hypothetical protein
MDTLQLNLLNLILYLAYTTLGGGLGAPGSVGRQQQYAGDEEDLLLQYAIRQSLSSTAVSTDQVKR